MTWPVSLTKVIDELLESASRVSAIGLVKTLARLTARHVPDQLKTSSEFVQFVRTLKVDSLISANEQLWSRTFGYVSAQPWLATQILSSWLEKALFNALVAKYFLLNRKVSVEDIPPTEESKLKKMKDILDHPLLCGGVFQSHASIKLVLLKSFMGTIDYLNIRNMLWHGFVTSEEFLPELRPASSWSASPLLIDFLCVQVCVFHAGAASERVRRVVGSGRRVPRASWR